MSDLIPWYLVELRSRLSPFLDAKLVETIVGEAKSHLNESITRLEDQQQISEDQATTTAVATFGSPEKVALSHLREHAWRPFGIKPIWLVTVGAMISTAVWILEWEWLRGFFDNYGDTWENYIGLGIGAFALGVFGIGCYASRKRQRTAALATCAAMMCAIPILCSLLIVSSTPYWQGLSHLYLGRDLRSVRANLDELNRLDKYLDEGADAYRRAKSSTDIPARFLDPAAAMQQIFGLNSYKEASSWIYVTMVMTTADSDSLDQRFNAPGFLVPSENVFASVVGRLYPGLQKEADFSHAVLFWRRNVAEAHAALERERTGMAGLLAAGQQAEAGRIFFFNSNVYGEPVLLAPFFLPALFFVDWLAFTMLRAKRRRPEFVRA